jgi:hypothetical protein
MGRRIDWIPNPSKFILVYEPPARLYAMGETPEWYQWHYRGRASDVSDIRNAPPRFYSPILFVDGHSQFLNFSKSLQDDPLFPYEETKDWMWYKPAPDGTPMPTDGGEDPSPPQDNWPIRPNAP